MKEELVNLNENQLNALREFYVERFVDNMETKDLVQYVTDDMFQYMESLPDNELIDECLNYWDDMFDEIIEHTKKIGISSEYFCEEFVFIPDGETPEECARFHDVEYFDITEFNYHHWIGNKMEDY